MFIKVENILIEKMDTPVTLRQSSENPSDLGHFQQNLSIERLVRFSLTDKPLLLYFAITNHLQYQRHQDGFPGTAKLLRAL
ncbi:hypothetical protein H7D58_08305 [Brucella melitensis]|uniref:hypothetical protein n=1 Tax=Brucella melitensis TaxID=29459 RepID=UPI00112F8030|nr:hypothetical protein [Brucella melitensis]MBN7666249.1 hypothetical protein [Brucella melitensis]MBN7678603.1 hypothetical protein [Brucella melitensis]MBN7719279.1 hypothetical protein [Brucella melitensis]MBN7723100.1 hypothetical protein [Brucella melitensis]MBO1546715.1 hypothetical protein [Brucella melitensis]